MSQDDLPFSREELAALELFDAADVQALEPVLRSCPVRQLAPREVLIAAGTANAHLYLVLSGELGIHLQSPESEALTTLAAGSTVGEISLLDGEPASAHVVAHRDSRVLVIDEELLWILADSSHAVASNLLRTLTSRLREGNQIIERDRRALARARFEASVDGLTGLFNRRWLDKMLLRQMERSRAEETPLSLLLIDVDRFKPFNDRHGHVGGDCALSAVAECLRGALRPTDMIARYGGEEFAVLLPGAALAQAREVGERLRAAVASRPIDGLGDEPLDPVTVSIGVAELPKARDAHAFIEAADRALYRAKREGRNRVCVAEPS
jgi:diguanylate cyclase (GGDEF)-like protein